MPGSMVRRLRMAILLGPGVVLSVWLAMGLGVTSVAAGLPQERSYELVTPQDKNGGEVMGEPTRTRAAIGGDAVGFVSFSAFGDAVGTGLNVDYVSVRGTQSWRTHAITPPQEPGTTATLNVPGYRAAFSDDLSRGIFRGLSAITDAPNVANVRNLYLREDLRTPGAGAYRLLTDSVTVQPTPGLLEGWPSLADASKDFRHVIFESALNLTADATGTLPKLYEWDAGELRIAGVLPDSVCATPPCIADSSSAGQGAQGPNANYTGDTLSDDGSRVIFTSPVDDGAHPAADAQLYMRIDHATTVRVNASEKAVPDPVSAQVLFDAATPDGAKVFFRSDEQLTNTPGNGLYMYDAGKPDAEPDNISLLAAGTVHGILGISDAGHYVYFVATDQLAPDAPADLADKIYVWHDGVVRYVGTFDDTQDTRKNLTTSFYPLLGFLKGSRVSSDGTRLVFTSRSGAGLTGYDHATNCVGTLGRPCSEVYVYDALASNGDGELFCASCRSDGVPASADAVLSLQVGVGITAPSQYLNRALSTDGRRLFFTSGERLVPEDKNGLTSDVYMYDTVSHDLHLLSAGTGSSASVFLDASANGDDVFFITRDRLVKQDVDSAYDLYDARVGGGFADPLAEVPPCAGEACRGPITPSTSVSVPGSVAFAGPGDAGGLGAVPVFRVLPLHRGSVRRWALRGGLSLRVEVSEPGRLRARAHAMVDGQRALVASSSRRAKTGGILRLRLGLSPAARAALRRGEQVRVAISVSYSPVIGAQRAVVTLRRPASASDRAVRGGNGR